MKIFWSRISYFSSKNIFPKLKILRLDEWTNLDTKWVKKIATNCLALEEYSSEWCLKIESDAVQSLILNCENLQKLSFSGIKTIDDSIFAKLFEKNAKNLKEGLGIIPLRLESLNLKMWNYISKPALEQMKQYYPNLILIDYYGEEIRDSNGNFTNYSTDLLA